MLSKSLLSVCISLMSSLQSIIRVSRNTVYHSVMISTHDIEISYFDTRLNDNVPVQMYSCLSNVSYNKDLFY